MLNRMCDYQAIHDAWTRIFIYADEKKAVITGSGREIYLNDPVTVPKEELLIGVQIPIKDVPPNK